MDLKDLRRRIDRLDERIVRLLNERAAAAMEIGRLKAKAGAPLRDRRREAEVLERVIDANGGPLVDGAVAAVYRKIIAACVQVERARSARGR